jgi:hypothetical protein
MLKITILHHVLSSPSTGISHASAAALRSAALLTGGPTRFGWERWAELAVQWAKSWGFHGTLTCGVNVDYIKWLAYDSRHVVDVFFFFRCLSFSDQPVFMTSPAGMIWMPPYWKMTPLWAKQKRPGGIQTVVHLILFALSILSHLSNSENMICVRLYM